MFVTVCILNAPGEASGVNEHATSWHLPADALCMNNQLIHCEQQGSENFFL